MTKMKGLLLGAAAGLATVASAQAADLPVKAAPVEYVKVCSLYGAGFFYIPGTDTCLKIGGYLRTDHIYGGQNAGGPFFQGANAIFNRDTSLYGFRARINLTTDFRTQSDYGTIRAYAALIGQNQTGDAAGTGSAGILRAFIQFAGFTVGHAVSYFDFFNGADYGYQPGITAGMGATGVNGIDLLAYTWQIGNGFSTSIDIEDNNSSGGGRGKNVINGSTPGTFALPGALTLNNSLQGNMPDVAGNVRVDQAWGSAQVMGAIHNASAGYYGNFPGLATGVIPPGLAAPNQVFGHPGEVWGWSVGAGAKLVNFLLPRDDISFQAGYCHGAIGYCIFGATAQGAFFGSGNRVAFGFAEDGIFANGSQEELSDAFAYAVGYQHYWNPQWRTSILGGQTWVRYSAAGQQMFCGQFPGTVVPLIAGVTGFSNCNPNFSQVQLGTRTAWNPHPFLEIGLEVQWNRLSTADAGTVFLPVIVGAPGGRPAGLYNVTSLDTWQMTLRFQKNILP
jgi:Porin subfamily